MAACFQCMKAHIPNFQPMDLSLDPRSIFLVGGSTGLVEFWMHGGMQELPEQIAERITLYCAAFLGGEKNTSAEQENGSKY